MLANEPIDSTDAADPMLATLSTDPTEPIDSTEFTEPIDRTLSRDARDRREGMTQGCHRRAPDVLGTVGS